MKLERGEIGILVIQFLALIAVVLLVSTFSPGQSAVSSPTINTVYWGTSSQGTALHEGKLAKVTQNESVITAYFKVAYSTQVSAVAGSRICVGLNSTAGVSTTYTTIPFSLVTGSLTLNSTVQQLGWTCTYTIKVTDSLSQTTTWLGSVELVSPT
jgi:hypothetical protein